MDEFGGSISPVLARDRKATSRGHPKKSGDVASRAMLSNLGGLVNYH